MAIESKASAALAEFNDAEEARASRIAALRSSRAKLDEVSRVAREWRIAESAAGDEVAKDRDALKAAEARSTAALAALMEAER